MISTMIIVGVLYIGATALEAFSSKRSKEKQSSDDAILHALDEARACAVEAEVAAHGAERAEERAKLDARFADYLKFQNASTAPVVGIQQAKARAIDNVLGQQQLVGGSGMSGPAERPAPSRCACCGQRHVGIQAAGRLFCSKACVNRYFG